ncbi:unnamed protein product [Amoebophrya sp. A120]|nr:unnamed protein product [Amoebophrya sp. A120]|eukprot:GSA120T00019128001.1
MLERDFEELLGEQFHLDGGGDDAAAERVPKSAAPEADDVLIDDARGHNAQGRTKFDGAATSPENQIGDTEPREDGSVSSSENDTADLRREPRWRKQNLFFGAERTGGTVNFLPLPDFRLRRRLRDVFELCERRLRLEKEQAELLRSAEDDVRKGKSSDVLVPARTGGKKTALLGEDALLRAAELALLSLEEQAALGRQIVDSSTLTEKLQSMLANVQVIREEPPRSATERHRKKLRRRKERLRRKAAKILKENTDRQEWSCSSPGSKSSLEEDDSICENTDTDVHRLALLRADNDDARVDEHKSLAGPRRRKSPSSTAPLQQTITTSVQRIVPDLVDPLFDDASLCSTLTHASALPAFEVGIVPGRGTTEHIPEPVHRIRPSEAKLGPAFSFDQLAEDLCDHDSGKQEDKDNRVGRASVTFCSGDPAASVLKEEEEDHADGQRDRYSDTVAAAPWSVPSASRLKLQSDEHKKTQKLEELSTTSPERRKYLAPEIVAAQQNNVARAKQRQPVVSAAAASLSNPHHDTEALSVGWSYQSVVPALKPRRRKRFYIPAVGGKPVSADDPLLAPYAGEGTSTNNPSIAPPRLSHVSDLRDCAPPDDVAWNQKQNSSEQVDVCSPSANRAAIQGIPQQGDFVQQDPASRNISSRLEALALPRNSTSTHSKPASHGLSSKLLTVHQNLRTRGVAALGSGAVNMGTRKSGSRLEVGTKQAITSIGAPGALLHQKEEHRRVDHKEGERTTSRAISLHKSDADLRQQPSCSKKARMPAIYEEWTYSQLWDKQKGKNCEDIKSGLLRCDVENHTEAGVAVEADTSSQVAIAEEPEEKGSKMTSDEASSAGREGRAVGEKTAVPANSARASRGQLREDDCQDAGTPVDVEKKILQSFRVVAKDFPPSPPAAERNRLSSLRKEFLFSCAKKQLREIERAAAGVVVEQQPKDAESDDGSMLI